MGHLGGQFDLWVTVFFVAAGIIGTFAGSNLIPLGELAFRVSELDPEQPVAGICQSGSRSQPAAALLAQKGFKKVYNVRGGMSAWQMNGLHVARN